MSVCNGIPAEVCLGRFVHSEHRHLESQQLIQREARATQVQCQALIAWSDFFVSQLQF